MHTTPVKNHIIVGLVLSLLVASCGPKLGSRKRNPAFGKYIPPFVIHTDGKFFFCMKRKCRLQKMIIWEKRKKIKRPKGGYKGKKRGTPSDDKTL